MKALIRFYYQRQKHLYTIIFLSFLISSCANVAGEVSFNPYAIPIKISVNTWGEISFELEPTIEMPTPLGTISAGVIIDPSRHYNVQNVLTIRLNGEDHYYDLHEQSFEVEFESGYYKKVKLSNNNGNILLELQRITAGILQSTPETIIISESSRIANLKSPDQFIIDYYAAINKRDYEFTWSLLSSNFKNKHHCCYTDGSYKYEPYVEWWDSVSRIEIISIEVRQSTTSSATVYALLRFYYKNGNVEDDQHIFQLIANTSTDWLINEQGG